MPGPLTVRQKCCDGSEKRLSWKRTSPQIWQRWAVGSGMMAGSFVVSSSSVVVATKVVGIKLLLGGRLIGDCRQFSREEGKML
jgi:hypothetical protein